MKWIRATDKKPPLWKFVNVRDWIGNTFVAKRTLFGTWKYKSGYRGYSINAFDYWSF